MNQKKCSKCKETKPLDSFYPRREKKREGKPMAYCKKCFVSTVSQTWKNKKIKAIAYLGNKCAHCENTYHRSVYQFHHLGEKEAVWDAMRKWPWAKIVKELDKCILLCANCHIYEHSDKD